MDPVMLKDKSKYVKCDTHLCQCGQGYCASIESSSNTSAYVKKNGMKPVTLQI